MPSFKALREETATMFHLDLAYAVAVVVIEVVMFVAILVRYRYERSLDNRNGLGLR